MSKKLFAFILIAIVVVAIFAPEASMYACPAIGLAGSVYSGSQGAVDYKHGGKPLTLPQD